KSMPALGLFAALLALIYLGGPVLIKLKSRMSARPEFQPLDPSQVPRDAYQFLYEVSNTLAQEGFELAACATMPNQVPDITAYVVLMLNPKTKDKALVTVILSTNPAAPGVKTKYLEFNTKFEDKHSVNTMN